MKFSYYHLFFFHLMQIEYRKKHFLCSVTVPVRVGEASIKLAAKASCQMKVFTCVTCCATSSVRTCPSKQFWTAFIQAWHRYFLSLPCRFSWTLFRNSNLYRKRTPPWSLRWSLRLFPRAKTLASALRYEILPALNNTRGFSSCADRRLLMIWPRAVYQVGPL